MNKFSKFQSDVICELHPLFRGLLWVSAARSTDETRFVLMNVSIEREGMVTRMIATDGRRLHVHEYDAGLFDDDIDLIPAGLYEIITKTPKLIVIAESDCGLTYPNWRNIIPPGEPAKQAIVSAQSIARLGILSGSLLATDFAVAAVGFGCGRKKDETALIHYAAPDGPNGAFVITHDIGKAIVMPIKQTDEDESSAEQKSDEESTPYMDGMALEPSTATKDAVKNFQKSLAENDASVVISTGDKDVTITKDSIKATKKGGAK